VPVLRYHDVEVIITVNVFDRPPGSTGERRLVGAWTSVAARSDRGTAESLHGAVDVALTQAARDAGDHTHAFNAGRLARGDA